jgi:hypothetical protein
MDEVQTQRSLNTAHHRHNHREPNISKDFCWNTIFLKYTQVHVHYKLRRQPLRQKIDVLTIKCKKHNRQLGQSALLQLNESIIYFFHRHPQCHPISMTTWISNYTTRIKTHKRVHSRSCNRNTSGVYPIDCPFLQSVIYTARMTRGVDGKCVFPLTFASRFQLYPARECPYVNVPGTLNHARSEPNPVVAQS